MMKRIGRLVVLMGLLLGLVVGCGQPTPGERDPGEPEVPADMSPLPALPSPAVGSPAPEASPGASPEVEAAPESD